jgi:hypothetical protein
LQAQPTLRWLEGIVSVTLARLIYAVGILALGAGNCPAHEYKNEPYRFSIRMPDDVLVCKDEPPNPNHGVALLLPPTTCSDEPFHDGVTIWAEYNAVYLAGSTHELARIQCDGSAIERNVLTLHGVTFDRCWPKRAEAGRQLHYVGLRIGSGDWAGDTIAIGVDIFAADSKRLSAYRRIAERVMRTLVFW